LGRKSNQFGHQAPGTEDEIHNFCVLRYDTSFDQFAKVEVNGDKAEPLYKISERAVFGGLFYGAIKVMV
jgi:glutathione peroxidase-family protein